MSGGALHQDEMGGGRGEDGATYRCRVNGVAGERREEGARKRPTRRHCAVRIPKKMLWTRKIQTVVLYQLTVQYQQLFHIDGRHLA